MGLSIMLLSSSNWKGTEKVLEKTPAAATTSKSKATSCLFKTERSIASSLREVTGSERWAFFRLARPMVTRMLTKAHLLRWPLRQLLDVQLQYACVVPQR